MNEEIIKQLEAAAAVITAPPNQVTDAQRRSAETVFLGFRKSKTPYELCRQILETSSDHYVLFEASEVLKSALIREWSFLQESDILSLRQYLMQYVFMRNDLPFFVKERILQVIAIIVKRGSVEDFGQERLEILKEIENIIIKGDQVKKLLGCNLISNLMQEYASTVKSSDVGLSWEVHFKAKKQFEATDLRKIFEFCVMLLSEIVQGKHQLENDIIHLIENLLRIVSGILTWGYVSPMLPKRLIGVYEAVYEADQAPALQLSAAWKDVMLTPFLLPLMFGLYWKVRDHDNLSHQMRTCLVQLATLTGGVLNNGDVRSQYLTSYLENFLRLLNMIGLNFQNKEALSISQITRKLQLFFAQSFSKLPQELYTSYLDNITKITCFFCERAEQEEASVIDDNLYVEAFDNMLEGWVSIFQENTFNNDNFLSQSATCIFNTYLKCHLAPPNGTRSRNEENVEIEDNEDNDRIRFKEQLQIIGVCGRTVPSHSLAILYSLLEDRCIKLKVHLQTMRSQTMTINDAAALDNLFEDIHWLILIAGHVLSMDSEGEAPMIPSEIMRYSIEKCNKQESNLEDTLQVLASVREVDFEVASNNRCDHAIRIFSDILKLCALESSAAGFKLGHFLSPEVSCTIMWFLKRWCLSYLLPMENYYQEISPTLIGALGKDTDGATFVINFVLNKIQMNICQFNSEPVLLQDTVDLFADIVYVRQKSAYIVKTEGLWNLIKLQTELKAGSLPQQIHVGLYKGFVLAGSGLDDPQAQREYYQQIVKPVQLRFKNLLCQENFNHIFHEENVKAELIDILECLNGIVKGAQMSTTQILYEYIAPVLSELSVFLSIYKNYQVIVQLVLELFKRCAQHMLCYLNSEKSKHLYESSLATVQTYAKFNANRLTTEVFSEESSFQDLLLVFEFLTLILSKDCLDFSPEGSSSEITITASDVSLFGLSFILPLIKMELLMYPSLCSQYYKLIVLITDLYPDKISNLPDDMLTQLLRSIELGLTSGFGSDIVQACLDFLQSLGTHIYRNSLHDCKIYQAVQPFLKLLIDLTLSHEISTELISTASICIYALICSYPDQYQMLVQNLIRWQSDSLVAERLSSAFTQLNSNVTFNCNRQPKLKFRDNFDRFIAEVHGFLLIK